MKMRPNSSFFSTFSPVIIFLILIWSVQIINYFSTYSLNSLGISVRRSSGLIGILFCPFLHANFMHAIANSAPIALMGSIILGVERRNFLPSTIIIMVVGGFLTWLLGQSNSVHVGASGVVFGYLGFLVTHGVRARSLPAILGAVAAILFYGYQIKGILPTVDGVSWEGHLFGLLGGIIAAFLLSKR